MSLIADFISSKTGIDETVQPKTSAEAVLVGNSTLETALNAINADIEELKESGGGGTTVVANPALSGSEAELTGLQVGNTKYKVPEGGGGVSSYEALSDKPVRAIHYTDGTFDGTPISWEDASQHLNNMANKISSDILEILDQGEVFSWFVLPAQCHTDYITNIICNNYAIEIYDYEYRFAWYMETGRDNNNDYGVIIFNSAQLPDDEITLIGVTILDNEGHEDHPFEGTISVIVEGSESLTKAIPLVPVTDAEWNLLVERMGEAYDDLIGCRLNWFTLSGERLAEFDEFVAVPSSSININIDEREVEDRDVTQRMLGWIGNDEDYSTEGWWDVPSDLNGVLDFGAYFKIGVYAWWQDDEEKLQFNMAWFEESEVDEIENFAVTLFFDHAGAADRLIYSEHYKNINNYNTLQNTPIISFHPTEQRNMPWKDLPSPSADILNRLPRNMPTDNWKVLPDFTPLHMTKCRFQEVFYSDGSRDTYTWSAHELVCVEEFQVDYGLDSGIAPLRIEIYCSKDLQEEWWGNPVNDIPGLEQLYQIPKQRLCCTARMALEEDEQVQNPVDSQITFNVGTLGWNRENFCNFSPFDIFKCGPINEGGSLNQDPCWGWKIIPSVQNCQAEEIEEDVVIKLKPNFVNVFQDDMSKFEHSSLKMDIHEIVSLINYYDVELVTAKFQCQGGMPFSLQFDDNDFPGIIIIHYQGESLENILGVELNITACLDDSDEDQHKIHVWIASTAVQPAEE